ncbi:ubiquitin fusion degradation protein UFD1-domain-containing protein [Gongronella butleri]|nr:ubiquitin fusion degradation protein UFD1-domain-containing protein [Gongronella butleri]
MTFQWTGAFIAKLDETLDQGDKIILPASALEQLLSKASGGDLPSPLTFSVKHPHRPDLVIHGGVREFSGDEGHVSVPRWMMTALDMEEQGGRLIVSVKPLPKGTWARLRPLSNDDSSAPRIKDYRAALESHLRQHYNTLTAGQTISCSYASSRYLFLVVDLKPAPAVCVTDTDLEVDLEEDMTSSIASAAPSSVSSSSSFTHLSAPSQPLPVAMDQHVRQTITQGQWQYFTLSLAPQSAKTAISLTISSGDIDVVIGCDRLPTLEANDVADISSDLERQLLIDPTTLDAGTNTVFVGIHGYATNSEYNWVATTATDAKNEQLEPLEQEDTRNKQQCSNCQAWVPVMSLALHESFCARNNVLCPWGCGKVFKRADVDNHWHCDLCTVMGTTLDGKAKHVAYHHTPHACHACNAQLPSLPALAAHKRTLCPKRLITCRYCHNLVAQGQPATDARDRILGLCEHESYCGSRTIQCQKCQKSIPIKDVPVHAKIHEVHRQQQRLPPICGNSQCTRPRANNRLGLCQYCFGPFWVTEDDPQNVKLIQRVARRLHTQLTHGCGNAWCQNQYCATSSGKAQDATTAASTLLPMIKKLRVQLAMPKPKPELDLCVDEKTTRVRFLANTLQTGSQYGVDWCIKALEAENEDLERAQTWLKNNAPTLA